jgi:hypothetical protein
MTEEQLKYLLQIYHTYAVRQGVEPQWNTIVNTMWGAHRFQGISPRGEPVRSRLQGVMEQMYNLPASKAKEQVKFLDFEEIVSFTSKTMRFNSESSQVGATYWSITFYPECIIKRGTRQEVLDVIKRKYSSKDSSYNRDRDPQQNVFTYMNQFRPDDTSTWILWETLEHSLPYTVGVTIMSN